MLPPEVLGPLGLTIALGIAVGLLWRDHLRGDARERQKADDTFLLARDAVDALKRLAAVAEKRNQREARTRKPP